MKLLIIIVSILLQGLVASRLWCWFVSEPFGIQQLSIAHALGLAFVGSVMTGQVSTMVELNKKPDSDSYSSYITFSVFILVYPLIWFFGWIIHSFM